MNRKSGYLLLVLCSLLLSFSTYAQSKLEVNSGADMVSRYIWRGIDFGKSPAVQPSLSFGISGFEIGFWGSYTLNETASGSDEIDTWISYTIENDAISVTALVTDYYFPNAGIKWGNFNNYDDPDGAGAHTLEAGVSVGFGKFPLSLSAYYNFYNDAGNNTYFQLDYPFSVEEVELNLFCGATAGSEDNPGYYGSGTFNVINIGLQASREIKLSDEFKLPVFVSYIINPRVEISHIVFGFSL
ncbi:MAG: hypothetical protein SCALA702_32650 [Melioribacteraceae bacterium]|nr:MAG: hypothetical protein SCALA702_32650 [Melioribacteraceae bacterium]